MEVLDHPFIVKLYGAFQDGRSLYMAMDLLQGGELFARIHTPESNGIEEHDAKFYAACIVQALDHMHGRNILYRDLKAENVVIDNQGYCILIDLGYAKTVVRKTYTMCGTPLYLAPEIILSRGYDKSVDHWSLGILLYEMLLGFSPFYSRGIDQNSLFKRIARCKYEIPSWSDISEDAKVLIHGLLVLRPTERLGSLAGGDADIVCHKWFRSINKSALLKKKIEAPWVPVIASPTDTCHENWDYMEDKYEEALRERPLSKREQESFKDF